jgi:taurine dioxygenase
LSYRHIEVRPLTGHIGAEILGADLGKGLDDDVFAEVQRAFLDHHVIVVRDQQLDHGQQIALARRFGEPDIHPIAIGMDEHPEMLRVHKPAHEPACFGTSWHTDNTFFERPSATTLLYGVTIPPVGGDTLFASTRAAFEGLSPAMQTMLRDLRAIHSATRAYDPSTTGTAKYEGKAAINYRFSDAIREEHEHPVVRTHPETGRLSLFVNPMFTQRIVGLHENESRALLEMLYTHIVRPEYTCRVGWAPGTLTIWDNRCTQHYALDDYHGHERLMFRVTITGDVPR